MMMLRRHCYAAYWGIFGFLVATTAALNVSDWLVTANRNCKRDLDQHHDDDYVSHLPGLDQPLMSAWFSGYLHYDVDGRTMHTHYVLVQAEDDWHNDKPLIYWSNGGPGSSSLYGLLTELGPYLLNDASLQRSSNDAKSQIPTPIYNPYSWNRLGSLLIFDQPPPVGFSYCDNQTLSHSCNGIEWNDELTSMAAYEALKAFYQKFPCMADRDLYLMGESYAGIYIPTLARRIHQDASAQPSLSIPIPLKGFAVGNACLGTESSICGHLKDPNYIRLWPVLFLAGHGQIPLKTYHEFIRACFARRTAGFFQSSRSADDDPSDDCQAMLQKVHEQVGGFNGYHLYDDCPYHSGVETVGGMSRWDYPCGSDLVMHNYLNRPEVRQALHVPDNYYDGKNFHYIMTEPDLTGFYRHVNGQLRVLVYNGDTDPGITSFAMQNWTSQLGITPQQNWRPWTVDGCRRMGGYVVRYAGGLDVLTIRGAGHMVPTFRPAASFAFVKSWIEGLDYPPYDKHCQQPT